MAAWVLEESSLRADDKSELVISVRLDLADLCN
jgi:hypothetical protein